MTAEELRIGNHILLSAFVDKYDLLFDSTFRETELTGFILGKLLSYKPGRDFENIETIKPIPLTEEWLLKLGFEKRIVNHFNIHLGNGKYFGIEHYTPDGFEYLRWVLVGYEQTENIIRYVHQLQNLYFALTGTELTIK